MSVLTITLPSGAGESGALTGLVASAAEIYADHLGCPPTHVSVLVGFDEAIDGRVVSAAPQVDFLIAEDTPLARDSRCLEAFRTQLETIVAAMEAAVAGCAPIAGFAHNNGETKR